MISLIIVDGTIVIVMAVKISDLPVAIIKRNHIAIASIPTVAIILLIAIHITTLLINTAMNLRCKRVTSHEIDNR